MERKFKVGDRVQIKSWEEMEKELGIDFDGNINSLFGFPKNMKHLCGRTAKIESMDGEEIKLVDWSDISGDMRWKYSTDMIKHLESLTLNDLQFADILTLRNGERYVVADGLMQGEKASYSRDCDEITAWYNDDLTQNEENQDEDIIKVERAGQVIFEREEVVEMTIAEISKKLGYEVKVVKEK